jgi:hypothetical protein
MATERFLAYACRENKSMLWQVTGPEVGRMLKKSAGFLKG